MGKIGRLPALPALLLLASLAQVPAAAQRLRDPGVRAGDCASCHRGQAVLPARHVATQSMDYSRCAQCHPRGTSKSLLDKLPLSHLHRLSGIGCSRCHLEGDSNADSAEDRCSACHDTTKLAAATKDLKPANPHDSPHYGKDMDCNLCHHQHTKSEDYCAQCHDFAYRVP